MKPDDVILTQIWPALNLNDDEGKRAGVFNPMGCACRNEGRFLGLDILNPFSDDHLRRAGHDNPMFTASMVKLEAQAMARIDLKTLDLIPIALTKNRPTAPGACFGKSRL